MKSLQLIQRNQLRGAEVFADQLSSQLRNLGHQSLVISLQQCNNHREPLNIDGALTTKAGATGRLASLKRLANLVATEQPDIIQCNAGDTLKYAIISKLLFRWQTPIIMRNASMISSYLKARWSKSFYRFLYHRVAAVASVSNASLNDLQQTLRLPKIPCRVIPIALPNTKPCPIEFPPNQLPIVHVGGFTFEKNHQGLLRIFQRTLSKLSNAHLHLVGDGPLRSEVEIQIASQQLQEHVTLHGFQPNPLDFMAGAKVVVLPSIIEGLPAVLLEAMSVKTPVIAYDVGGIRDLVIPEKTGHLIRQNDEIEFAHTLIQVLQAPDCRLIEAAFQLAHSKYSIQQITHEFLALYQAVI